MLFTLKDLSSGQAGKIKAGLIYVSKVYFWLLKGERTVDKVGNWVEKAESEKNDSNCFFNQRVIHFSSFEVEFYYRFVSLFLG